MAGPSVMVSVFGDLKGLGDAFKGAGTAAQSAAGTAHEAFSGMLGALNATGVLGPFSGVLDGIDQTMQTIAQHGKDIGPAMLGVGAAVAGIGAGLSALGSKDQSAHQQLQGSVEATGKSYDDYSDQVDAAIKSQENFGHTSAETQNALQILTQATGDPAKALQYLGTASDLAAAKHESLGTAATQLGKTYNGSGKLMKDFSGVQEKAVDTTGKMEAATKAAQTADENANKAKQHLADVQDSLKGKTTLTAAETIRLRDAQQKVTDTATIAKDAHQKLADTTQTVVTKTQAAGSNMDILAGKLKGQASASADTFSGKLDSIKAKLEDQMAAMGEKYGPAITGIGSALAGLGGAWSVISDIMAADWFAAFWPVALIVLAIAGVGVAIYLMRDKFVDVFNWLKDNWPLLLAIITGPFGLAVLEIKRHWGEISDFFKGIPKDMEKIWDDIWGGMSEAFRSVLNDVIHLWNSLHFTLPKLGPFGGETVGVPHIDDIPHLAQGGLVTQTGLIYAHAGEAITPMPSGGLGPALHIENATFSDAADIDLLMAKTEFAVSAGRL